MYNNNGLHASALIISPSFPSNFHGNQISKYVNISLLPQAIIDSLCYYLSTQDQHLCKTDTAVNILHWCTEHVQSHYSAEALLTIQLCNVNNAFLETITN